MTAELGRAGLIPRSRPTLEEPAYRVAEDASGRVVRLVTRPNPDDPMLFTGPGAGRERLPLPLAR